MAEAQNLSHTRWQCKYHVVFIPKCRRKTLYRQHLMLASATDGIPPAKAGMGTGNALKKRDPMYAKQRAPVDIPKFLESCGE